ncbi:MAG: hypothetical protein ACTHN0_08320 [Aquihabitans sp.]
MAPRRLLPLLFVALSIGVASCGSGDRPTQVAAGGDPSVVTSTSEGGASSTTAALAVTTSSSVTVPVSTTTSTTTSAGDRGTAASPVDGLDAAQLQQAVEAPVSGTTRSAAGATVDQVTLSDGTHVWRVRVPGDFQARSARVAISVGDRIVGEGVLASDLRSITAVTTDGTGLTEGRPVSYQWEGGPSVAAGILAVVR